MNWQALNLSLLLGCSTAAVLIPVAILLARQLAWTDFAGRSLVQALVALPLLLPPTVLGYYLLLLLGRNGPVGGIYALFSDAPLVFSFQGLWVAALIFNLPFAVHPIQRAFESIPVGIREAAWCCGLSRWMTFVRIELPLVWPGLLAAIVLTLAHTLGEFGVVLMVGGNIQGETQTISIAIYDRVQAFDNVGAGTMSAILLLLSLTAITGIYTLDRRFSHGRARH